MNGGVGPGESSRTTQGPSSNKNEETNGQRRNIAQDSIKSDVAQNSAASHSTTVANGTPHQPQRQHNAVEEEPGNSSDDFDDFDDW